MGESPEITPQCENITGRQHGGVSASLSQNMDEASATKTGEGSRGDHHAATLGARRRSRASSGRQHTQICRRGYMLNKDLSAWQSALLECLQEGWQPCGGANDLLVVDGPPAFGVTLQERVAVLCNVQGLGARACTLRLSLPGVDGLPPAQDSQTSSAPASPLASPCLDHRGRCTASSSSASTPGAWTSAPEARGRSHARAGCSHGTHARARRQDDTPPGDLIMPDRLARAPAMPHGTPVIRGTRVPSHAVARQRLRPADPSHPCTTAVVRIILDPQHRRQATRHAPRLCAAPHPLVKKPPIPLPQRDCCLAQTPGIRTQVPYRAGTVYGDLDIDWEGHHLEAGTRTEQTGPPHVQGRCHEDDWRGGGR